MDRCSRGVGVVPLGDAPLCVVPGIPPVIAEVAVTVEICPALSEVRSIGFLFEKRSTCRPDGGGVVEEDSWVRHWTSHILFRFGWVCVSAESYM